LDEHDRRQIIIRLIINPDEFMQERKDKIVEMMSTLSQEESIQFLNLLKKINEKLDNTND